MSVWYAWSNLHAYIIGTLKGLFGLRPDWFRTPKFMRGQERKSVRMPVPVRALNVAICVGFLAFYFSQGWLFGWMDPFALLWLPAALIASFH